MSKLILEGYILVEDADLLGVMLHLPEHIKLTRAEPGCISFDVTRDSENRNRFNVQEVFLDENAFNAHQERVRSSEWGAVSRNVERHYKITKL